MESRHVFHGIFTQFDSSQFRPTAENGANGDSKVDIQLESKMELEENVFQVLAIAVSESAEFYIAQDFAVEFPLG
jgi:hypothetical protein